jgi:hypothetical protein
VNREFFFKKRQIGCNNLVMFLPALSEIALGVVLSLDVLCICANVHVQDAAEIVN